MWQYLWRDPDRRRALLLSLVVHLSLLLILTFYLKLPGPTPRETFLVIEIGTPAAAEIVTEAPAADDPAPAAPDPQVADSLPGEPQAQAAPDAVTTAPEPSPRTEQPEPPQAGAPPQPAPEPTLVPVDVGAPTRPTTETPTTALPEINDPDIDPRVQLETVPIPVPAATELAPAQLITPTVEVAATELAPQVDPLTQAETVLIPTPAPTTEVAPAQLITPTPTVEVAAAQPVPLPDVQAAVAVPQAIPTPAVQANVSQAQAVPLPDIQAAVAVPQAIPTPAVQANVSAAQAVPLPDIQAAVAAPRSVTVQPQVEVRAAQPIPTPQVAAAVAAPQVSQAAPAVLPEAAAGAAAVASPRDEGRPAGGDAIRPGQTTTDDAATVAAVGAAAAPDGGAATGTPAQPQRTPFSEQRERPLAVMIDNADGYPQSGLREAGLIVEMPVEGGLTRLMTVYDRADPGPVGPVRSARPYFVELSQGLGGVLVHAGGSPEAMAAIDRAPLPTLNSQTFGDLFRRVDERSAPYDLYTGGSDLRQAVRIRLQLDTSRLIQGLIYRPATDAASASEATVRFSGNANSGFRYLPELDLYRWVRNGSQAVDANGEAVLVDAVVIASIESRPIPNDTEGRLYIPLSGGRATLLLRGTVIEGSWRQDGGVRFFGPDDQEIELAPFKTWVAFTPVYEALALVE